MIYYGLAITGTDTGVGKTELGCGLARAFKEQGIKVGVFKPVETGCKKHRGMLIGEDAQRMIQASGAGLKMDEVAPYRFSLPSAPLSAARAEGKEILFEKIFQVFDELAGEFELMLVETAGGLLVPVNDNFLFADLLKPMNLPVLIVAEDRLGVINQVLLTIESARSRGLQILGVILNQTKPGRVPAKLLNAELIEQFGRVRVLSRIPYLKTKDRERKILKVCQKLALELMPEIKEFGKKSVLKYI
jgi:dethiobiotin synthetase